MACTQRLTPAPPRNGLRALAGGLARALGGLAGALLVLTSMAHLGRGQEPLSREHTIKAAYLYNLGRYITWPANTFADRQTPFVIGLLEPALVGADLEKIARLKTLDGRTIAVERYSRPEDVQRCQILFFPRQVDLPTQRTLIRRLAGSHVLLVGESEGFLDAGGIIAFVVRDNNVRLMIGLDTAQREGLQISAKLLQIAQTQN